MAAFEEFQSFNWYVIGYSRTTRLRKQLSISCDRSDSANQYIVYHCKSDTVSLHDGRDIVLSTTHFLDKPLTLAVMYGCTEEIIDERAWWLERCAKSAFHPLVLPMIFADIERSRFLDAIDLKATELEARILELESRVKKETTKEPTKEETNADGRKTMTERDCNAIQLCRSMTSLKNGLVSLATELQSMRNHLQELPKFARNREPDIPGWRRDLDDDGTHIDAKLKAIMDELQSKRRTCEGFLGAMTMATQMVRKL
ncbi:hypothetical protein KVR01_012020 [Diaporthe batatas]|uniref:uncharacterized protein n=1 Tax=Diaporthe batatas TaxID=748121 RepID=UPI001D05ABB0|nr:uncharacterized protein KVR01_012020 [Diaporthe batatas]KAG8158259.1 hypothetical protein KVR01_012020 [Diaporthe batatas]